jgi:meso-butanediol dehydrogenase/(S,S)-butanediol dehydrogenase/diacetyl reductase
MTRTFEGQRFVITGGATGIGYAIAQELTDDGAQVCLVGRRQSALDDAVERLGSAAWSISADVSSVEEVARVGAEVRARWDRLDGLVNNAGIAPMATLAETDPESWDHTFAVNVRGPYLVCREFLSLLADSPTAAIVNVSSTLAEKAIPGMAAYNASKAALNQMTRSLALEVAPGVRVNAVMPAVVDTPIHAGRGMSSEDVASMGPWHPMQRVGRSEEVAAMVVFLLSGASSWTTGAVIPVDGGMLAG